MADDNYSRMMDKIAEKSGVAKEELERRVEAKRSKLSGLISKEGAAQVIAAELGISFEDERLKIEELLSGMRKVNVVGKIIRIFPVRTFTNRKGDEGKVCNFVLADDTSNIKVVLWDTNHIALIEKGEVKEGSVVEIANGSMRDNEIHLGSFSEMKPSSEKFDNVVTERVVKEKPISDFRVSEAVKTRAFIVQNFEPRFFHVCPECGKKAVSGVDGFNCSEHGKVEPKKRALMNLVLDDGTENIRAVVFSEGLEALGFGDMEDKEILVAKRNDLLGKELVFTGNVRNNNYFNNIEIIVEDVKEPDVDKIIAKMEKK